MILYTGLRRGEALALQGKDIDIEQKTIYVNKNVYFKGNKAYLKEPKTEAGNRTIPILEPLLAVIPHNLHPEEFLFHSFNDPFTPMGLNLFRKNFDRFILKTDTNFTPHELRHSYATILYECGIDAKTAQHLLGHAQISTTLDIYTDFRKESHTDIANILNSKLS